MKLLDERHVKCKYFIIKSTVLFARKANFAAEQQSLGQFQHSYHKNRKQKIKPILILALAVYVPMLRNREKILHITKQAASDRG